MTSTIPLLYSEVRDCMRRHPLRQTEVPIEHAVSLPLPTRRLGANGYAFFAAPATRQPGEPVRQGAPDRWWVLSAASGRLLLYALTSATPFAEEAWTPQTLPLISASVADLQKSLHEAEELMDAVASDFFEGNAGDYATRQKTLAKIEEIVPAPLLPQYRGLTPDFFAWLQSQNGGAQ